MESLSALYLWVLLPREKELEAMRLKAGAGCAAAGGGGGVRGGSGGGGDVRGMGLRERTGGVFWGGARSSSSPGFKREGAEAGGETAREGVGPAELLSA